jgi:carboxylesterase type B
LFQSNIESFGGDPNHIILAGGSAGGMSIMYQLIREGNLRAENSSVRNFHGAIMHSGSFLPARPVSEAQESVDYLANEIGCDNSTSKLECLRTANFTELLDAISEWLGVSLRFFSDVVDPPRLNASTLWCYSLLCPSSRRKLFTSNL